MASKDKAFEPGEGQEELLLGLPEAPAPETPPTEVSWETVQAISRAARTPQPDRVSRAQYELGGNPTDMSADSARALGSLGFGGQEVERVAARDKSTAANEEIYRLTGPKLLSEEQLALNARGRIAVLKEIRPAPLTEQLTPGEAAALRRAREARKPR